MAAMIVLLPLFGTLLAMPLRISAGARAAQAATIMFMGIACILSWWTLGSLLLDAAPEVIPLASWIGFAGMQIDWAVRVDALSAVMMVVVTTVSFLVHLYSVGYMADDPEPGRFFLCLSFFTFAMLALVTADNFVQLFFGWEGVGLASYLLIGFWRHKESANAAALKAFVVNRVGDLGLIIALAAIFYIFRDFRFDTIFSVIARNGDVLPAGASEAVAIGSYRLGLPFLEVKALPFICVMLFIGAAGKSAQLFLHVWLPDAMEGPTPVSALIHAATMVTAGVFLVCRCAPFFDAAPSVGLFVATIGAITAFFAATVALFQNDIKRIIAYSTCSQLGYMFVAAGLGAYQVAMFHLFTHAFFKAMLFLGAGSVIVGMHHAQDIRSMGGCRSIFPLTYVFMLCGTAAITGIGVPLLYLGGLPVGFAGFVSKDLIIEHAFAVYEQAHHPAAMLSFILLVIAAIMTAFYSWRLIYLTFHGDSRATEKTRIHPHAIPRVMHFAIAPLLIGAVFSGVAFYPVFKESHPLWEKNTIAPVDADVAQSVYTSEGMITSEGTVTSEGTPLPVGKNTASGPRPEGSHTSQAAHPAEASTGESDKGDESHESHGSAQHHPPAWVRVSPFIAMLLGWLMARRHYDRRDGGLKRPGLLAHEHFLFRFFANKWYFDELYEKFIIKPLRNFSNFLWRRADERGIDKYGPEGVSLGLSVLAQRLLRLQSGYIFHYAFAMLAGMAVFIAIVWLRFAS